MRLGGNASRGWKAALSAAAALLALAGGQGAASAHTGGGDSAGASPQSAPRLPGGASYEGLAPAKSGPCEGMYVVKDAIPGVGCTHGPDAAPPLTLAGPLGQATPSGAVTNGVKCIGDGVSGPRIEVIYAHAADRPDLYWASTPLILQGLSEATAQVEESAAKTGGYRSLRFLTSGCEPVIRDVTLSAAGDDSLAATATELNNLGFNHPERDYLVFVDSDVYCGIAYLGGQYARVDRFCWNYAELHELTHNFGAVQPTAPNSSGGGHCTDESDVMCYSDEPYFPLMRQVCDFVFERLLDCNGDDYFSTAPPPSSYLAFYPQFNTADSPFMADVDGEPPLFLPEAPPTYTGPRYTVRAYNADDDECVYGEGPAIQRRVRFFCVGYRGDRTEDVTGALLEMAGAATTATLRLVATERGGGTALGFTVLKDGVPILDEKAGEAGIAHSGLWPGPNDPITGWPVFYDRAIAVDLSPVTRRRVSGAGSSKCLRAKRALRKKAVAVDRLTREVTRMYRSLKRQHKSLLRGNDSAARSRAYRRQLRKYNLQLKQLRKLRKGYARSKRSRRAACRA